MAETPGDSEPAVVCSQCGFENDADRRFCRDCGARLPVQEIAEPPPTERAALRPKGRPGAVVAAAIGTLFRIAILAAGTALVIQLLRAPDGLPATDEVTNDKSAALLRQLGEAAAGIGPKRITASWPEINAVLARALPAAPFPGDRRFRVAFQRAVVLPGNGDFRLEVQRNVIDRAFYVGLRLRPVSRTRGMSLEILGGNVGRVSLPGPLAQLMAGTFDPVRNRLHSELEILRNAQKVTLSPEVVSVDFP